MLWEVIMRKMIVSILCCLFLGPFFYGRASSDGSKPSDSSTAKKLQKESVTDMKRDIRDDMDAADDL
jgi:hypothetical protein